MFICTDLTETIVDGGERNRLRSKLQGVPELEQIWYFPDHLFLLSKISGQLDSFRLLDPRCAATSLERSQNNARFSDIFLNKLLRNSLSTTKTVPYNSTSTRLDSITVEPGPLATVVQVERLDEHVFLIVSSDGSIRAYRFDAKPACGWTILNVRWTTDPSLIQPTGSVMTSAGVVPRQTRTYTLYWCEQDPKSASPWNCSVFRRHFRVDGSPPREVVFEEPTAAILESCPASRFVFGKADVIIWFPPGRNTDAGSATSPAGLVVLCTSSSKISALIMGSDRMLAERSHATRDFWSCCVDVLSDMVGNDRRLLDVSSDTNDRLVVRTSSDISVVDWSGTVLIRRNIPEDAGKITGCAMFGSGLLCLIGLDVNGMDVGNRFWVADLDNRYSEKWTKVVADGAAWSGVAFNGGISSTILLWSAFGLQQITRHDLERVAGIAGLAESRLLTSWDAAYRLQDLSEFHPGLRAPGTRPPLDYSVALPLVIAHHSVDHAEATPQNVLRSNETIRFLENQSKSINQSYTIEERHLLTLFETFCRVQRTLHPEEPKREEERLE